jgi:hypothetical protein
LADWKQIAGKGQEMQDIFWHMKEAIDSYFQGRSFAVTVHAGCVRGRKDEGAAPRVILPAALDDDDVPTGEVQLITGDFDIIQESKKLEELDGVDEDEPDEPIL